MTTLADIPTDSAARFLAELARNATDAAPLALETKGLGDGLSPAVPILWDRQKQAPISLKTLVDEWRQWPARRRGTATADTLASFIALTNRHKDAGSVIFARAAWPKPHLTAVVDYHTDRNPAGDPPAIDSAMPDARWGTHRIVYTFPLTEEFKAWAENDGTKMSQLDFAHFLEEHAAELAAPLDGERTAYERLFKERFATPAELLGLSRNLEIFVGTKVKRQERLATGERVIEFTSENRDLNGKPIDVPGIFMISLPAFIDGDAVRIPARLRYRPAGGDVVWFYQLYRWEYWLRTQVQSDLSHAGRETGLPTFEGEPEQGTA